MAQGAKDSRITEMKDTISQLNAVINSQNELIKSLKDTIENLKDTITNLQEQLDYLKKKLFGRSSEKSADCPGQMSLFNEPEQEAAPEEEETPVIVREHARKAKRNQSDTFKGIPSEDVVIPLSDGQKVCPNCGAEMEVIGKEFVRQEFQFTPAKGKVVNIYVETAKCPVCTEDPEMEGATEFAKAEAPAPLIPHSYATSSSVAWVMYQKYCNAMPLYRQEADWEQLGVSLLRVTMANWIIYCALNYFAPLYDFFHRQLLARSFAMADETRCQVLHEPDRAAETDSFMWLFRSGEDGLPTIILFKYTETRAKSNAVEFLKGYHGYLETDCYQGYDDIPGIKRCCCWAHLRRYFVDAVPQGKKDDLGEPAAQGVQYCDRLFAYERRSKELGHSYDQRKEWRLQKEKPVLDAFWKWVSGQDPRKGSRFEKAVKYALNHKSEFMTYLEDGRCSFSNNLSENSLRPFTVGRKNWLFSNTAKGAEASAIVYTMVEMARAHGLNVYKYLKCLLDRLPGAALTDASLSRLVPWDPEIQEACSGPME